MKILSDVRLLLIGLWLGAAVFFIAVAQSAFAVLPSRELAGSVVSRTLLIINVSGLIIGLILLVTSFFKRLNIKPIWLWTERVLLIVFTAACAVGQFVIGLWMSWIRAQIGRPIDEIAVDDPLRIQFNNLHQYSEWILMAAMVAALVLFFLIARKSVVKAVENKNEFGIDPNLFKTPQ
ncbi:hypothetical protein BH20ACI1_BH20ACI1_30120 [soil metagenome]